MAEDVVTSNYIHTNNAPAVQPLPSKWWMRLFLALPPCSIPHVNVPLHEENSACPPDPDSNGSLPQLQSRSSFLLGLSARLLPLAATSQHHNCGPRDCCICTWLRGLMLSVLCVDGLLFNFVSVQRYIREGHFPCNPCTPRQG
jgi:hypothetical protein